MGYESKIYVVEKFDGMKDNNGKCYASVVATFDMCKCPALANLFRYKPEASCYFYADDRNTKVVEDCYGEPLTEATVKEVIEVLTKAIEDGYDYWRVYPLLSALMYIDEIHNGYSGITIVHYGY